MSELRVLEAGRARRSLREAQARRRRRRRRLGLILTVVVAALVALLVFMASGASGPSGPSGPSGASRSAGRPAPSTRAHGGPSPPHPAYAAGAPGQRLNVRLKLGLRSGLLFDVRTGRVLWQRDPSQPLAIASLTKMMTALVVVDHAKLNERVLITPQALHYSGSGVGLLPRGKRVQLGALLYGLMLPSGNDAAIALAQHVSGTQTRFIGLMNARARALGLGCTHFTSVSGIVDQGNRSCARDLAVVAHAVLMQRVLRRIVATRSAVLPFPIKGGKLYLYNNNPLFALGYPGTDGVKTGYTVAAGRCLVAAARHGRRWLAVVLLNSGDPPDQAVRLLNAGFAARG